MSINTAANLFIVPPLRAGFYQHFLGSVVSFQELGNRLVRYAQYAHAVRRVGLVREAAEILSSFPLEQYQSIGQYYLAWCDRKKSDNSTSILEKLTETAPAHYRARAMHVLATIAARKQESETELHWLMESLRVHASVEGFRGIAVLKAREGFHASALKSLEDIIPYLKHAEPLAYYDFLNSYAVELGEAGRKQEARNISRIVLASSLASAYPEWQETARELKGPARSFVALEQTSKLPRNVVHMPLAEHVKSEQVSYNRPAKVTDIQQWKVKMGKDDIPEEELTTRQMIFKIIDFFVNKNTSDYKRYQLWEAAQKIMHEPDPPDTESDDTEGA